MQWYILHITWQVLTHFSNLTKHQIFARRVSWLTHHFSHPSEMQITNNWINILRCTVLLKTSFFFFLLLQSLINKLRISWSNTWIGEYFYNYFLSYPNQRTNQKVFQHILCIHICLLFSVLIWYWFSVINSPPPLRLKPTLHKTAHSDLLTFV